MDAAEAGEAGDASFGYSSDLWVAGRFQARFQMLLDGGLAPETRSGGSVGSRPVAIIEAENPSCSCGIALRVNIIPGTLSTQALVEGPSSRCARSMLFRARWLISLITLPSG